MLKPSFTKRSDFDSLAKMLLTSVAAITVSSCQESTPSVFVPAEPVSLIQRVQNNYSEFYSGDLNVLFQSFSDDFIWESGYSSDVPFGGEFIGDLGTQALFDSVTQSVEIDIFNVNEFTSSDSMVVATGCESARVIGSNIQYINQWVHRWDFNAFDQIETLKTYNDSEAVAAAFRGEILPQGSCEVSTTSILPENPELVAQVQSNYAAFGNGDFDTLFASFDPGIVWESRYSSEIPYDGIYTGIPGFLTYVDDLIGTVEVLEFVPQHFTSGGNVVVVFGFDRARIRESGVEYFNAWAHRWEFRNGLVTHFTGFNDSAAVASAFRN